MESGFSFTPLQPFERQTLPAIFLSATERFGAVDAVQFRRGGSWQAYTFAEVRERVEALAASLDVLGVAPGDRVAVITENRPEWTITDFAVLCMGAIDAPLYPTLLPAQLAYILNDCGARVAVVSSREQYDKLQRVRAEMPALEHIILMDAPAEGMDALSFEELVAAGGRLLDAGRRADFEARARAVAPEDVATIIYTSGTTGHPKGVVLTHYNLAAMVAATGQHGSLPLSPGDTALSMLPVSHVFERAVDYYYWDQGATIAFAESVKTAAEALKHVRPHAMVSVPRLFEKIYQSVQNQKGKKAQVVQWAVGVGKRVVDARLAGRAPSLLDQLQHKAADRLVYAKVREQVGGRIRTFISGGAPLPGDVARFFIAAGMPIHEGYGLTETSPVLAANRPGQIRIGSVGVPYPGVELRLEESGEIVARTPGLMQGYWNRPDMTAEVIAEGGWFHTGDIGRLEPGGFLSITDRLKDLIVTSGGKNIAPQPIERCAVESPFVSQAILLGDRRPYTVMLVAPDWERLSQWAVEQGIAVQDRMQAVRDARLQEFLEQEVLGRLSGFAKYELPRRLSVLAEEFTLEMGLLTPSLKIKRRAVEEYYRQLIDSLYRDRFSLET